LVGMALEPDLPENGGGGRGGGGGWGVGDWNGPRPKVDVWQAPIRWGQQPLPWRRRIRSRNVKRMNNGVSVHPCAGRGNNRPRRRSQLGCTGARKKKQTGQQNKQSRFINYAMVKQCGGCRIRVVGPSVLRVDSYRRSRWQHGFYAGAAGGGRSRSASVG